MLNRSEIMDKAIIDCYRELYKRAQPSADYDELSQGVKDGTVIDTDANPIYKRYYLSQEDFKYIVNKYLEAYRFKNEWLSNMDIVIKYLEKGGLKDIYVKDKNGTGHREAEKTKPIKELIGEDNANIVLELLKNCKDFYRFDREESQFSASVYLGGTPTSNKEDVIEYWKSQGKDITIVDRVGEQLWYEDYYGDNWKQVMEEENEY